MKNVAKCDTWCELQNPVNHRVFERKLRPKPHGRGHACLGVTHHVAPRPPLYGAIGWGGHWPPVCIKLAAGLNEFTRRPPSRQALVEHSTLFLSCWTERRVPIDPKRCDPSYATPGQAGPPAEFKHINKRRKRNLRGFP
ncbi:Unknown protein [Striga hermonthica]|uniref:Uncharacterized protein n=1 Tax=Striga hermonthica TaxID=68872 RepID=A0A9N7NAR6_STRHE|nr:Unknown protein [Striga hermonthica]